MCSGRVLGRVVEDERGRVWLGCLNLSEQTARGRKEKVLLCSTLFLSRVNVCVFGEKMVCGCVVFGFSVYIYIFVGDSYSELFSELELLA